MERTTYQIAGKKALVALLVAALVSMAACVPMMLAPQEAQAKVYSSYSNKALAKQAGKTVAAAKATKGKKQAKAAKICRYIVKKYDYYPMYSYKINGIQTVDQEAIKMKNGYKYIATPTFANKKGSCYGYASVMALSAKSALGKNTKVRIAYAAVDKGKFFANETFNGQPQKHAWTEVLIGSTWYIYDANLSEYAAVRFGDANYVIGKDKNSPLMKQLYKPVQGKVKYVNVTL